LTVLYLTEQGSRLSRDGHCLVVSREGEVMARVPAGLVEQVVVFGNISITTPALTYLLRHGVDCVFLSQDGHYFGRLVSGASRFGLLRQAQYRALSDEGLRLQVARGIVCGKLDNYLHYLALWNADPADLTVLREMRTRAAESLDVATLRGLEGLATAAYFAVLRSLVPRYLAFLRRNKRPPKDPVNSMLSLGYTLLAYVCWSAVEQVGLDVFGGFLHATVYSRPSLALDLIEELRTLVDDFVLQAVRQGEYGWPDFQVRDGGVFLSDEARKRYLRAFQERVLERQIPHPSQHAPVAVRRALELQARQVADIVLGRERAYRAIALWASRR